ncbi:MAG: AAA family ATPase [Candidatus Bathyarchaeota archaeon]|nr:AAA family ATPase [Candidatus Bathyarchaeota archaeon]
MSNPSSTLVRKLEAELASGFVGREEEARVAILALLTRQHAVFIGEPGTAKSALIRRLSQLVQCRFFYYLLSKYTVPDELIGAIDPVQYKSGRFVRNTKGKLPEAEIAFIDEVFKGSSETLNTLLNIMNERLFVDADGTVYHCPLWSLYGASNEVPTDSELAAFYDRFLLRHFVKRIDASKLEQAIIHNITMNSNPKPIATLQDIAKIYDEVTQYMIQHASAIAKVTSQLVIVLRQHGIFVSDRTATSPQHLPRLIATYSYVYNTDLRKAAIAVSKYVLPNEEALESYRKALDALVPVELREASEKLDKARDYAASGDLASAKRYAAEAIQAAQSMFGNPEKAQLFKDEIKEILEEAERLVQEITRIEESLKKFKKG